MSLNNYEVAIIILLIIIFILSIRFAHWKTKAQDMRSYYEGRYDALSGSNEEIVQVYKDQVEYYETLIIRAFPLPDKEEKS